VNLYTIIMITIISIPILSLVCGSYNMKSRIKILEFTDRLTRTANREFWLHRPWNNFWNSTLCLKNHPRRF